MLPEVPKSQASYQAVLVFKLIAEKAIASEHYTTTILMMDTSVAFDTAGWLTALSRKVTPIQIVRTRPYTIERIKINYPVNVVN